ncbi:DUF3106 domain-containing protein [Glaciimonas sp. PCH181]|uniref:DUF3106 domain-containing protein n=1 Tax=Glaciimonas sp. PCH181 TaxID=2133943 RepID=UPI000D39A6FC|nr:DUF3106 domain-containing protein [Glaciimonas sp. PCH181]PUA16655.1 hypothetical protein C7W93_21880 [Glaciimonas sp. PCH181]
MALVPTFKKNSQPRTDNTSSRRAWSIQGNRFRAIAVTLAALLGVILVSISIIMRSSHAAGVSIPPPAMTGELAVKPKPINPANPSKASKVIDNKSDWSDLTAAQKLTLAPLATGWDKLKLSTRKKWIEISKRFNSMSATEQARVQERMHDWGNLTPEQRREVRENYARTRKLDTEERAKRWAQYQQLPEEEKQKLAAEAATANNRKRVTAQILSPPAKTKPAKPIQLTPQPPRPLPPPVAVPAPQPVLPGEPSTH